MSEKTNTKEREERLQRVIKSMIGESFDLRPSVAERVSKEGTDHILSLIAEDELNELQSK